MRLKQLRGPSVVVILTCAFAADAQPAGEIAFQSKRDGQWEIYSMAATGSGQRNLTQHSSRDLSPAWSPDGDKIAFASDRTGSFKIFVMNGDGSDPIQLTRRPGHHVQPEWSPDGTQIAYASNEEGSYDLCVMGANGEDPINVTQSPAQEVSPTWSPDGTQLAFSSDRDGPSHVVDLALYDRFWLQRSRVFVMDALGGNATALPGFDSFDTSLDLAWSPDGSRVAAATQRVDRGARDVVVTSIASGDTLNLTAGRTYNNRDPAWSPDGAQLAYSSFLGDQLCGGCAIGNDYEIYIVSADGGEPVNISQSPGSDQSPSWRRGVRSRDTSARPRSWGVLKAKMGAGTQSRGQ